MPVRRSRMYAAPANRRSALPSLLDRGAEYAAEDADVALRLWKLPGCHQADRVYEMVDRPLAAIVEGMERAGIMVIATIWRSCRASSPPKCWIEGGYEPRASPLRSAAPSNSAKFVRQTRLKGGRKGKSGDWSTDQNELERLERDGSRSRARSRMQLAKLKSTYTDAAATDQSHDRASTLATAWLAQTDGCRRPTRTCKISRSGPKPGARSATPLSPRRPS